MTALHHVAEWSGSIEPAHLLPEHRANLNSTTRHGHPTLDHANDRGRTEMTAHLTKLGAQEAPSTEVAASPNSRCEPQLPRERSYQGPDPESHRMMRAPAKLTPVGAPSS